MATEISNTQILREYFGRASETLVKQPPGSTLAQVMAWCLTAPSHYLKQSWLIISEVQRQIRAISQEMPQPSVTKIPSKFTYVKFHLYFPGANELMRTSCLRICSQVTKIPFDDKLISVQVMTWCCQAKIHSLRQFWLIRPISHYVTTRPQWVNSPSAIIHCDI